MALKAWRKLGKILRDALGRVIRCAVCPCGGPTTDRCCGGTFPTTMYMTCYLYEANGWPTWTYTGISIVIEMTYDADLKITDNNFLSPTIYEGGWKGTGKFDPSGPTMGVAWTCNNAGGITANFYQDQGAGIDFWDGVDDVGPGTDGSPIYKYIDTPAAVSTGGIIDCDTKTQSEYNAEAERAAQASFYPIDWVPSIPYSQDSNFLVTP